MVYDKNVFQIWKDNNEELPFFVRRHSWSGYSKFMVTDVTIKEEYFKETGKLYGTAMGYFYNDNKKQEYSKLNNAGSYQWLKVD